MNSEVMDGLRTEGGIQERKFAIFTVGNARYPRSEGSLSSAISFGGWNLSKFSPATEFTYVQSVSESQWEIRLDSLLFGGIELLTNDIHTVVISQDPFLSLPSGAWETVTKLFGSGEDYFSGFSCDLLVGPAPSFVVKIGPLSISITEQFYVMDREILDEVQYCTTRIKRSPDEKFVLGYPFLQSAYIGFDIDNKRIGVAPSANNPAYQLDFEYWSELFIGIVVGGVVGFGGWACWKRGKYEEGKELREKLLKKESEDVGNRS